MATREELKEIGNAELKRLQEGVWKAAPRAMFQYYTEEREFFVVPRLWAGALPIEVSISVHNYTNKYGGEEYCHKVVVSTDYDEDTKVETWFLDPVWTADLAGKILYIECCTKGYLDDTNEIFRRETLIAKQEDPELLPMLEEWVSPLEEVVC